MARLTDFHRQQCSSIYFLCLRRVHIDPIILPTPFTRKPLPQDEGESLTSSSQGSMPMEGRKQEDSKPLARGVPKLHRRHLH
jgi:hypothetical protein